ncbi:High-affinity branched-chain amino acid transport ATP-binding protein LivF [Sporomusa termitida]|uniref:High-affinity branched-chain amino acid transport ATP-binding protein LivF n=1 Tax=Sporomusa termitida TaxID=2377 RepID=A0A517DPB5_9FIRM|nr:High-affinity branched-chain amino acid transport ATP-binding protein LivF [Sporomusa termitida]
MTVLKLENINTFYGHSQALENIAIDVQAGEFVTILGANGAGKSTIMKTIMGLVKAKTGTIYFNGRDISQLPPWDRAGIGIGYVPEGRRVFPDLSVEENLRMGAYSVRDDKVIAANIEKSYVLFPRLKERKSQLAKTMSGGEQQMLAIARALMLSPKLLLIDEISMGLMPILVNHSLSIVKKLNDAGLTILMVEQNANKALKVADRGYILKTGKIIMQDTSERLRNNAEVIKAYLGE